MNKSDSIKNIATAMALFQGEIKNPPKSADNPFFKSKYTTLDVLIDTAKPLLKANGLSYLQSCSGDGQNITVTTLLMHNSGEWVESEPLTLKADKATAQGAGSAITYARRYALAAVLGLASDEDDDGNGASGKDTEKKPEPKPTRTQLDSIGALATRKGINLKVKGVEWTKKGSSSDWTMTDYTKVKAELEKLEDKHVSESTAKA